MDTVLRDAASPPRPLDVGVAQAELDDLRARLRATRWPPAVEEIAGDSWAAGMPVPVLRELTEEWAERYDWRAHERAIAALPHVLVPTSDPAVAELHAVHVRGTGPDPLPLVLTHGWPSTFHEWHRVIGPLTDPAAHGGDPADAFHVVAPSLPGYGFSAAPTLPGVSPRRIAGLWVELMASLGYPRFAAHGCDWGSFVTSLLGLDHPERVVGVHLGMVSLGAPAEPGEASDADAAYKERVRRWRRHEHGYVAIQGTKPTTLAPGLTDSPAGLAAWVAEKWWAWSDRDEAGEPLVPREDLLTTLSLYWFTRTIGSASRLYYESQRDPVRLARGQRVEVPCGFLLETAADQREGGRRAGTAAVPRFGAPPRERVERAFDVHRWTETPVGGHFPALETPELFVEEVRAFFRPLRTIRKGTT
jgi:pimeloyl-ACP methyl ester carboxylesterase